VADVQCAAALPRALRRRNVQRASQLDGIWHTSVVVGGVETFFGNGIQRAVPGATPHGAPVQVISLGCAALPYAGRLPALRCTRFSAIAPALLGRCVWAACPLAWFCPWRLAPDRRGHAQEDKRASGTQGGVLGRHGPGPVREKPL
jgi:hypothetical protein